MTSVPAPDPQLAEEQAAHAQEQPANGLAQGSPAQSPGTSVEAELRARLAELEQLGVRTFDAPAMGFIANLLDRAGELGGTAAARLWDRAGERLAELEQRARSARDAATRSIDSLVERGFARTEPAAVVARGDYVAMLRAARKYRATTARRVGPLRSIAVIPTARAEPGTPAAGSTDTPAPTAAVPAAGRQPGRARPACPPVLRPAAHRYRESAAELATAISLDRARHSLPGEPGPYNGQLVAVRLIEAVSALAPIYAHAQLERMRTLAMLALLPDPAQPKQAVEAKQAKPAKPPRAARKPRPAKPPRVAGQRSTPSKPRPRGKPKGN